MSWQLSTASTEVLDDGRQRRYCLIILRRLQLAAPSTSPDVEHVRIGGLRPRFLPHFSNHFLGVCSCDVTSAKLITQIGLRVGPRPGVAPTLHHTSKSSRCHGDTPVRSRCVGRCAQRAHHRKQQRHRRSEWAGVSWPKGDDHERDAAGGGALARRQGIPHRPITPQMLRSVRSFARWRAWPHVSASIEN